MSLLRIFIFIFKKTCVTLLKLWEVEDFANLKTHVKKNLKISSPMVPNKLGTCSATEPPGHKPLVVNRVVVGPFEEEEEETGVASEVVKVEGEDPATPGPLT